MKHILLPEENGEIKYYKVNLHCHSTFSDGKKTPEELKEFYKKHGYGAVAFTDHDIFITHNDLTDDKFVALNGFEFEISEEGEDWRDAKTCHICYVALSDENNKSICYHRTKYITPKNQKWRPLVNFDENEPDYEREYTKECINDMIKKGKENGFFVTYNHPTWSGERYPEYMSYEGMDAMEISNYSSAANGYDEYNGRCYDDMLCGGKKIYCVSADDNHNLQPDGGVKCDSFGGYICAFVKKLDYKSLTDALLNGHFYSVTGTCTHEGPKIKSLSFEDGKLYVKTSEAAKICFICNSKRCQSSLAENGKSVTEAVFNVYENEEYFRIEVYDEKGYRAYSNAYFLSDLK